MTKKQSSTTGKLFVAVTILLASAGGYALGSANSNPKLPTPEYNVRQSQKVLADYPKDASVEDIARLYGMNPGCLGSQYVSSYFTNAELFKNPVGGAKNCPTTTK